jgi:hypothetical protein
MYTYIYSALYVYYIMFLMLQGVSRSKAWTVLARSNTGIVGSNPIWGMDVYVHLYCVGSGLATGWSPVQGVLPCIV